MFRSILMIETVDIVAYLQSKGVQVKTAGPNDVHCACFFCGESIEKRGRLYISINSDPPGLFQCHLCGRKGGYLSLRKHFGDEPLREPEEVQSDRTFQINAIAAQFYAEALGDREDVYRYLKNDRGLTVDTIIEHQLGWADGTLHLELKRQGFSQEEMIQSGLVRRDGRDCLINRCTIVYHINGNAVMVRGRAFTEDSDQKYITPQGQKSRLYNTDKVWQANTVIITEGEYDCLAAEQMGFAAVGVPGANSWQPSWSTYFDNAKRVYVLFDSDAAGQSGMEKVCDALGPKARGVTLPEGSNDLSEWMQHGGNREGLESLLLQSQRGMLKTPAQARDAWREVNKASGLKLGFPSLDFAIRPGLLEAQIMMILAKTGTGKTMVLVNIFHNILDADPDAKILFLSLEQTEREWFERARMVYRFHNLDATDDDCVEFYQDRFYIVDENVVSLQQLRDCVDQFEIEVGKKPDLIAIDYLGYWARSFKGEPYQRLTDAVMALKAFAKERRVRMIVPHQVNRIAKFGEELSLDSGRDGGTAEETADFVLALWSPDARKQDDEQTGQVLAKILKSRHGHSGGAATNLRRAALSYALVPLDGSIQSRRAADEFIYDRNGDGWDAAIFRHRTGIQGSLAGKTRADDGTYIDAD
jgi:hypothetical protein